MWGKTTARTGAEWSVLRGHVHLAHEVEEGGLAHVGQAHDAHLDVVAGATQQRLLLLNNLLGGHGGGEACARCN